MSAPTCMITGGAGYIGSHAVLAFREAGAEIVVIDDLSTGRRWTVPDDIPFYEGAVSDSDLVRRIVSEHAIDAVIHFAGSIRVDESVADPLKYYRNNTCATRDLVETCVAAGIENFLFSSTAAVYGVPDQTMISESVETRPINPYGASKLATESILRDVSAAHDFRHAALRYFNAAGADPSGRTGQMSNSSTHLIKVATQAAVGARDHIDIYGDDYDTPDGTCIRDYVHVSDIARAHVDAVAYLMAAKQSATFNIGTGRGASVREVLAAVGRVSGRELDIRIAPRRPGDPPALVADSTLLQSKTPWRPTCSDLDFIVKTAFDWQQTLAERGEPMG